MLGSPDLAQQRLRSAGAAVSNAGDVASALACGPVPRAHAAVGFHPTATAAPSSSRRGERQGTLGIGGGSGAHHVAQMTTRRGDLEAAERALSTGGRGGGNSDGFSGGRRRRRKRCSARRRLRATLGHKSSCVRKRGERSFQRAKGEGKRGSPATATFTGGWQMSSAFTEVREKRSSSPQGRRA